MAKVLIFLMKRLLNYIFFILDVLKSNFGLLKNPYKLNFVITKSCNSKFLNCHIWKVKPENEITLLEIDSIAKNSPYLKWVDLTGGEPTNRTDFVDIVKVFNKRCKSLLYVHFPTNGILTDKIYLMTKEISKLGNFKTVVTVSIDEPERVNDHLRGVSGDFKKAVNTYKKLKGIKNVDVYIGCTLFNSNYQYIEDFYKELKESIPNLKFKDLHFNLGHVSEHFYENTTPLKCLSGISSLYISEHGMVYPCSMWDYPIQNLREVDYNIENIKSSKEYHKAIKLIDQKKCSQCWTPCEAYQSIIGNIKDSF